MTRRSRSRFGLRPARVLALLAAALCGGCSAELPGAVPALVEAVEILKGECGDCQPLDGNVLELGTIAQGAVVEQPICFRNHTGTPIRITEFESSCECLAVTGLAVEVPAGGAAPARVGVDMQETPSTSGDFEFVVTLVVEEAESVTLKVRLTVEAAGEPATSGSSG